MPVPSGFGLSGQSAFIRASAALQGGLKSYTPPYASKEEYFAAIDALECDNERIRYTEDGASILF